MKKIVFVLLVLAINIQLNAQSKDIYSFKVQDIMGNEFDLSSLIGKKILIVNTASKCGFTPQYEDLQNLYEQYNNRDFEILAFPANNFMNQEPGSDAEIRQFCTDNYEVTFPVMSKISVKGQDMHPLYKWLTTKELNGVEDSKVSWNFQKYMINEKGQLVGHVSPKTNPFDQTIINFITGKSSE